MRAKIVGSKLFKGIKDAKDSASLLVEIKTILYEYKGRWIPYLVLNGAKLKLYSYHYKSTDSNMLHYTTFEALVEVVEHYGGTICRDRAIIQIECEKIDSKCDLTKLTPEVCANFEMIARDKSLAVAFLKRSSRGRYGSLLDILDNQLSLGTNQYPTNISSAFTTINYYLKTHTSHSR